MARGSCPQSPGQRVFMIFLIYCVVSLFDCMMFLHCPLALRDILYTLVTCYSLFVLKVLLNTN